MNLPDIQNNQDLQPQVQQQGLVLAGDPSQNLEAGRRAAKALMDFAKQGGALINLQGKQYLKAEGWLFLARAFGLTARVTEVQQLGSDPLAYQATAQVLDQQGHIVGQGVGICGADEKAWKNRPAYALASMAQTRATSKALRSILAWVAVLAGCSPTPSEEVVDADFALAGQKPKQQQPAPQPASQAQLKKLAVVLGNLGHTDKQSKLQLVNRWLQERGQKQVSSSSGLTEQQAMDLIRELDASPGEAIQNMDEMPL